MDTEIDVKTLKYVLYARKSTAEDSRQVRSIQDQISDCESLRKRLGLNVVDILEEQRSAKTPHLRPIFTQMLKDVKAGKYDAILAWNPDRLARNMLEGGQIIDMIDQGIIKDLKFVTHFFTHDANGKMLLGMAFVLSKQYSDDLSQKVTRGTRKNLSEGKSAGTFKHGYIRDKDGFYRPDGTNFDLIAKAWGYREQGVALETIVDDITKLGYTRVLKSNESKKITLSKQILSNIFKDPFYYGVLVQANQEVDLRQLTNYEFAPMISEQTYLNVQQFSYTHINPYRSKKPRIVYYPLKQMVKCKFCSHVMYPGASRSGSGLRYLYYRCDNDTCTRKRKSMRGEVVFNFIYKFLADGLGLTEVDYTKYLTAMRGLSDKRKEELRIEVHSKEGRIRFLESEIRDISYKLLDFKDNKTVFEANTARLNAHESEVTELKAQVSKSRGLLKNPESEIATLEQFLNLSKNAGAAIENGDTVVKDTLCRLIFLNFTLDEEKVVSYQLKPPFDTLLKTREVLYGRGSRT